MKFPSVTFPNLLAIPYIRLAYICLIMQAIYFNSLIINRSSAKCDDNATCKPFY